MLIMTIRKHIKKNAENRFRVRTLTSPKNPFSSLSRVVCQCGLKASNVHRTNGCETGLLNEDVIEWVHLRGGWHGLMAWKQSNCWNANASVSTPCTQACVQCDFDECVVAPICETVSLGGLCRLHVGMHTLARLDMN